MDRLIGAWDGAAGASEAAIGRAAMAWLEAEVARVAEPAGGVA